MYLETKIFLSEFYVFKSIKMFFSFFVVVRLSNMIYVIFTFQKSEGIEGKKERI